MSNFQAFLINQIVGRLFKDAPKIDNLGDILTGGNGSNSLSFDTGAPTLNANGFVVQA